MDEDERSIDLSFVGRMPTFGDLLNLCGVESERFAPSEGRPFAPLSHLQVQQVDDFFGVRTLGSGAVVIWIFPLLQGAVVDHHPGPFDGLRILYACEHHSPSRAEHYARTVLAIAEALPDCTLTWTGTCGAIARPISLQVLTARLELG